MQPIAMYERAVEPTIRALPGGLKNRSRRADFTQPRVALMVQRAFIYNLAEETKDGGVL